MDFEGKMSRWQEINQAAEEAFDWFFDNFAGIGCLIFFLGLGVLAAGFMWAAFTDDSHQRFMEQCLKDHKEYECTAMWRAGEKPAQPVPFPIVVPVR